MTAAIVFSVLSLMAIWGVHEDRAKSGSVEDFNRREKLCWSVGLWTGTFLGLFPAAITLWIKALT